MTASALVGCATQLACRAAQAGTTIGGGAGVGLGVGLGDGLGSSDGLGLGLGDWCLALGVARGVSGPLGVQDVNAAMTRRRPTPILTPRFNEKGLGRVTRVPGVRKLRRIPRIRLALS